MSIPAFTLPYTDDDLTNANVLIVSVNGGSDVTVTIPLPGDGSAYYNYKGAGTSRADSFAKVFGIAVGAATGLTLTAGEVAGDVLPGMPSWSISGGAVSIEFKWTEVASTFDGSALGFDTSANLTVSNNFIEAKWPAGRMFLPRGSMWVPSWPEDEVWVGAKTLAGKREDLHLASGANTRPAKASQYPLARVLLWAAADADWYETVHNLIQGDPNTPFEAFWKWLGKRKPIRYHAVRNDSDNFELLDIKSLKTVSSLLANMPQNPRDAGMNPLVDIRFDLQDYVP